MYVSESEGANFWLQVLTDLHHRGLEDILIPGTDNLKGISEAILSVFPKTQIQKCIVHRIRNSLKYVASKDQKEFIKDLKLVYKAINKELSEDELLNFSEKWGSKYPVVIESWERNWEELSTYFEYREPIRKIIYTTKAVEGFHRQVRKVTKTKGAFTSDMALLKLVYLSVKNIENSLLATFTLLLKPKPHTSFYPLSLAMDQSTRHIALAYRHAICLVIVCSFISIFFQFHLCFFRI
ncbi:MAG: putative transposase [Polaribacter sp.]|jgi:putative transposase